MFLFKILFLISGSPASTPIETLTHPAFLSDFKSFGFTAFTLAFILKGIPISLEYLLQNSFILFSSKVKVSS